MTAAPVAPAVLARVRAVERAHGHHVADRARVAAELEDAARGAGDGTTALRASLLAVEPLCSAGDFARAASLVTAAASHAEVVGDDELLARTHHTFAILSLHAGDPAEATWHAVQSVEVLPADAPGWLRALHLVCLSYCVEERPASFDAVIAEALDLCAADGAVLLEMSALNNLAYREWLCGRPDEALRVVARMRALSDRTGVPLRRADLDTAALAELAAGAPEDAWRSICLALDPASPDSGPMADVDVLLTAADVLTALGRPADALARVHEAGALASRSDLHESLVRVARAEATHLAAAGDFRGAYEAMQRLQEEQTRTLAQQSSARSELALARHDAERTRRERDAYRTLAYTDALTGLPNRRAVEERVSGLLAAGQPLAAAIVDVDHFKRVNDELSHEAGDAVLRELAAVLTAHVAATPGSSAARLGGEEFVLVWSGSTPDAVDVSAEALRAAVAARDWDRLAGGTGITVSIGCAALGPDVRSWNDLLALADARLYEAKRGGRDRVVGTRG